MKTQLEKANKILGTNYKDWYEISKHKYLTEDFIREFQNKVDWLYISAYQKLSESFIREFKDKVMWFYISRYQHLSESFIREFKASVYWDWISEYQDISDSFIEEFKDKINKTFLKRNEYIKNRNKAMTKKDLQLEKANKILGTNYKDWYEISKHNYLTEDFIREFKNKVDWGNISYYQQLSEPFIREFKDSVSWVWISTYQHLSESFIREFKDKVDWDLISQYQNISDSFLEEFKDKINKTFLEGNEYIKNRNKAMTKKDLKPGHIVELRNGERYLVVTNSKILFIVDETNWNDLSHYTEDLINNLGHSDLDIIKIYEFTGAGPIDVILWSDSRHKLIWERKEEKEVTMDQIAKAFGTTTDKLRIKK